MFNITDASSSLKETTSELTNNNEPTNKFPTIGLKSLLQNSELLDLLLKPLKPSESTSNNKKDEATSSKNNINEIDLNKIFNSTDELVSGDTTSGINIEAEINLSKTLFDWDLDGKSPESENNASKVYGNAFLGQNLWDKNDLLQGEKLGVKFETLDFEDFLNENSLDQSDVEFLDRLQKVEANKKVNNHPINVQTSQIQKNNTSNPTSPSSSSSISSSASVSPNLIIPQPNNRIHHQQQQQQQLDMNQVNLAFPSNNKITINPTTSSSTVNNSKKNISNWNIDTNEISIDSFSVGSYNSNEDYEARYAGSNSGSNVDLLDLNDDSQMKMFEMSKKSKKIAPDNYIINNYSTNYNNSGSYTDTQINQNGYDDITDEIDKQFVPSELKDDKYWTRRRKNNLAAKRSRDARRMKENQIAIRASFLERENDTLKKQMDDFKRENKLLKMKLARYEAMNLDPK